MIAFLAEHIDHVISLVVTLIGVLLTRVAQARVRLIWSERHKISEVVQLPREHDEDQIRHIIIQAKTFLFQNEGRATATNIEITFYFEPMHYSVYPRRPYNTDVGREGSFTLKFSSLAPSEAMFVDVLASGRPTGQELLPDVSWVRSDQATGREAEITVQKKSPSWFIALLATLAFLGAFYVALLFIRTVEFLYDSFVPQFN